MSEPTRLGAAFLNENTAETKPLPNPSRGSKSDASRHWRELDGVRGLAALLVVYSHLFIIWIPASPVGVFWLRTFTGQAWTGVYLFFLLSGFLIGGILMRNRESTNYARVFYTRRAYRIFPPYFLLLGVFVVARYFLVAQYPVEFTSASFPFWNYFALVQNFPMAVTAEWGIPVLAVTWSVALEEQFYLFLPLWVKLISTRWLPISLLGLAAIGPVFRAFAPLAYAPFLVPGSAESLFLGTFLAWAFARHPAYFKKPLFKESMGVVWITSAVGMAALVTGHKLGAFEITIITLFWCSFLCLVLAFIDTRWTAWLRVRPIVWIGTISYSVYLFHSLINSLVFMVVTGDTPKKALGFRGFCLTLVSFGFTLTLAAGLYHLVEKRLMALGRRHSYAGPGTSSAN